MYPDLIGKSMPQSSSDHISILLRGIEVAFDPKPFKFENMWLKDPGFVDLVRE